MYFPLHMFFCLSQLFHMSPCPRGVGALHAHSPPTPYAEINSRHRKGGDESTLASHHLRDVSIWFRFLLHILLDLFHLHIFLLLLLCSKYFRLFFLISLPHTHTQNSGECCLCSMSLLGRHLFLKWHRMETLLQMFRCSNPLLGGKKSSTNRQWLRWR